MTDTPAPTSERAGCLTAWLILLLIVLALASAVYFYGGVVLDRQGARNQGFFALALAVAFSVGAAGSAALLSRRRYGFWLIAAGFVFAALLQGIAGGRIDLALAGLFNLGVIWWLLRPVWRQWV